MKIISILKRTFVLSIFMMFIISCQKDDTVKTENDSQQTSEKTQKIVNASDIPKVMEFLKTKTNNQLTFELGILSEEGIHGRQAEPDLIITDAETENIIALTNAAGITNYTFKLQLDNAPVFQNEISFFNLIVKEVNTDEEFYGYIQEYRMDKTWYRNNGPDLDFSFYDGKMVIYTLEGLYVSALNINQGIINHAHYKSPCPDEGNPSGGGGSGEPGGPIGSPPGGSGGSGGSGGNDINVEVICGCSQQHPGGSGPNCDCPLPNIPVNIHLGQKTMEGWIINQLKSPCPPLQDAPITCYDIYNDPCTLGCNLDGTCFEENEEIPINPPPFNIALMMDLEEFLNQDLTQEQKNWIHANYANYDFMLGVLLILNNTNSQQQQIDAIYTLFDSKYLLINTNNQSIYVTEIIRLTNHLRLFGDIEAHFIADYIESLIPDFVNISIGEVHDIYQLAREQVKGLTTKYLFAVVTPFAEAAVPFITYALFNASANLAIQLFQRIPLAMVLQGTKLNKMVIEASKLGVQGNNQYNRIITTQSAPVVRATAYFNTLTKNAVGITNHSNGMRVANMGNGNYITFRPQNVSQSNFPATIDFNFPNIWSQLMTLKFL